MQSKQRRRRVWAAAIVTGALLASAAMVLAGSLDSPGAPTDSASLSYSLEGIYERLQAGALASMYAYREPSSGPDTATMHTLSEIMAEAPQADNSDGATRGEVAGDRTFWGLRTDGGGWGPSTGTASVRSDPQGPSGAKTFDIPDGFYRGKQAWCHDGYLHYSYIKQGVVIFATGGNYRDCQGNAAPADVLYPRTFTNSWQTGLTGQRRGGCFCGGTLNGTRWCGNGNGTVTDLTTCLVWLQKADWGGAWRWREEGDYEEIDDAFTRAGLLKAGATGANLSDGSVEGDWRLPTKTELVGITQGIEPVSGYSPRAFTGVSSSAFFWSSSSSSTVHNEYQSLAWAVGMGTGAPVEERTKSSTFTNVWPVRGGP